MLNRQWKRYKLGAFLNKSEKFESISDFKEYKQITVKMYGKGVVLRGKKKGTEIATKKQFVANSGQFILSRIDARNGAFGIVPKELDNAVVTIDFPVFQINNKIINPYFFDYFIQSNQLLEACRKASKGTTNRQRLKEDIFLNLEIPLPPPKEQKKIVEKLNILQKHFYNLRNSIEKNRQLLNNFTTLQIKKIILEYHSSLVMLADQDYFEINNKTINPGRAYGNNEFYYIDITAVEPGGLNRISKVKKIKGIEAPSRARKLVHSGDVILSSVRPYLKSFALISPSFSGFVCSTGFHVVTPSQRVNPGYLFKVLSSDIVIKQMNELMKGAHYPALNYESLLKIKIPLPDIKIQDEIVQRLNILESKISTIKNKNHIKEEFIYKLYPSLLQKALSGELIKETLL